MRRSGRPAARSTEIDTRPGSPRVPWLPRLACLLSGCVGRPSIADRAAGRLRQDTERVFYSTVSCGAVSGEGRRPSGQSLKSSVIHRPKRPGGASSRRPPAVPAGRPGPPRSAPRRPASGPAAMVDWHSHADADGLAEAQPAGPRQPIGTIGTPARNAKNATPSLIGWRARSPAWMRPSGRWRGARRSRARLRHAWSRPGGRPVGVVRDATADQVDEPVAHATDMSASRAEEPEIRTGRETRHHNERSRPALVVEQRIAGPAAAPGPPRGCARRMHEQADPSVVSQYDPAGLRNGRPDGHLGSNRRVERSPKFARSTVPPRQEAGFRTRTTVIPAARPARTPLSDSSTTRHRSGEIPRRRRPPGRRPARAFRPGHRSRRRRRGGTSASPTPEARR